MPTLFPLELVTPERLLFSEQVQAVRAPGVEGSFGVLAHHAPLLTELTVGLIKVTREGTAAYALPPRLIEAETSGEDRLRKLLLDLPIEIHEAGLLLVVRTLPGSAHAIAAALDRARWREVAGSVAGDDTLFVAFPDRGSLQRIKRRLVRLTEGSTRT